MTFKQRVHRWRKWRAVKRLWKEHNALLQRAGAIEDPLVRGMAIAHIGISFISHYKLIVAHRGDQS